MTTHHPRHDDAPLTTERRHATTHIAVSPHHLASAAGADIMKRGGNAVDGAIAVNAVLGVVLPDACGPGGDLFALIHRPGQETPAALNASGRAGSGVDAQRLRDQGHIEIPHRSPTTITVPGCVDGWEALLEREGTMTLGEVLAPAIELAASGFEVSAELGDSLENIHDLLREQPSAGALYPGGRPPRRGTILTRKRLAETLTAVANGGRDAFYGAEVGRAITEVTGGAITAGDLARRQADWTTPVGVDAFGVTGWTIPPNSQGYVALAAAWGFDQLVDLEDPTDPAFQHALIEAYRCFAAERDHVVADPDHAPLAPSELVSPDRMADRIATFDPARPARWPMNRAVPGGTAFMCTRDGDGTAVSLIQSNYHGIGSGISAGDTGVFLHDRGAGFTLIPGHPNELAGGKRPFHTLSPTLWTREGQLEAVIGTRGGEFQPQYLLQTAANLFRCSMAPNEAQAAPRWRVEHLRPSDAHRVHLEDRVGQRLEAGLTALGHETNVTGPWQPGWGPVSIIRSTGDGVIGAADPRVSTASAVAAGR